MKKAILLFLVMFAVLVDLHAQMAVYVRSQKGDKPVRGVIVYSFSQRKQAKAAYEEATKKGNYANSFDKKKYGVIAEQKTDANGSCLIDVPSFGALILDGGDAGTIHAFRLFYVEDHIDDELDSDIELVLDTLHIQSNMKTRQLGEVTKRATGRIGVAGGGIKRHGGYITIERDIDISENLARSDARFVAMPTIHFLDTVSVAAHKSGGVSGFSLSIGDSVNVGDVLLCIDGDTLLSETTGRVSDVLCQNADTVKQKQSLLTLVSAIRHLPPAVIDGKEYGRSMVRRMSFVTSRDRLSDYYFDKGMHLENQMKERIHYSKETKIAKGTKYYVPGVLWYEDYNAVYHEESILFNDGMEQEPMRFLDWDAARQFSPIDVEQFYIQGQATKSKDSTDFKIKFEQGKEYLNLKDSNTVRERDNMISWLSQYYNMREGELSDIEVLGYSSPEGLEARNKLLSHGRARTILQLLTSHFPDVKIKLVFDKNSNIVPWETVVDSMSQMNDTLAHYYAEEIRKIIIDRAGFDAQYRAIKANDDLYDYLDKNVLDRVRVVRIKASITVNKVLTKEEIITRYKTDASFRNGKLLPYQYYTMICHLADVEDWDELYKVSQNAYMDRRLQRNEIKRFANPLSTDSSTYTKESPVPYPLAGYYYAVSCMRKGLVDLEILKPYLDDGPVGDDRNDGYVMNSLPFIVAQVLMYCQDEDFDGANKLIEKYNLMKYPDLLGLIMFVRCLDGQYQDSPEVRDYVMSTSVMNKAVMLTALGKYSEALGVLYGDDIPENEAKVEYLRAICLFRKQNDYITRFEAEKIPISALYVEEDDGLVGGDKTEEDKNAIPAAWASPIFKAFKLDKKNIEYFPQDGYFNNAYRQMIMYAWKRMQSGVPMERIAVEYNALIRKMEDDKKKMSTFVSKGSN